MHMLKSLSLSTQGKKKKTVESLLVGDVIMLYIQLDDQKKEICDNLWPVWMEGGRRGSGGE